MAEASQAEVTIHCVDPLALTLLVDFSYTGELAVCEENVQVRGPLHLVALTRGTQIKSVVNNIIYTYNVFIVTHGKTLRLALCESN